MSAQSVGGGLEPLCAGYHRNTLVEVELALRDGHMPIRELLALLGAIGEDADGRFVAQRQHERSLALHLTEKERLP